METIIYPTKATENFEMYDHLKIKEKFVLIPFSDFEAPLYAVDNGENYVILLDRDYLFLNSINDVIDAAEVYYKTESIIAVRELFQESKPLKSMYKIWKEIDNEKDNH